MNGTRPPALQDLCRLGLGGTTRTMRDPCLVRPPASVADDEAGSRQVVTRTSRPPGFAANDRWHGCRPRFISLGSVVVARAKRELQRRRRSAVRRDLGRERSAALYIKRDSRGRDDPNPNQRVHVFLPSCRSAGIGGRQTETRLDEGMFRQRRRGRPGSAHSSESGAASRVGRQLGRRTRRGRPMWGSSGTITRKNSSSVRAPSGGPTMGSKLDRAIAPSNFERSLRWAEQPKKRRGPFRR